MKYRPIQYAQAFLEVCENKSEAEQKKIVKRFVQLLVRYRATGSISAICTAYEKLALQSKGMRRVQVEVVNPISEQLKKDIHAILGKNIHIEEVKNPDLLGGVKILVDDEILIDASARRHIENLFIATSERHRGRF